MVEEKDQDRHRADNELTEFVEESGTTMTTTLIVGAAVAIFAPELLVGMAVSVAAMLAPKVLPVAGSILRPLMRTAVRAGYATAVATREVVAEAGEQVQDMVAEARTQQANGGGAISTRKGGRRTRQPAKRSNAAKA